jgi:hypothetical protein
MELNHASIGVSKQRSYPDFHEIGDFGQPDHCRTRGSGMTRSTFATEQSVTCRLLARLYDHAENRFINGFRMLPLGWNDGSTFPPVDFAMLPRLTANPASRRPAKI